MASAEVEAVMMEAARGAQAMVAVVRAMQTMGRLASVVLEMVQIVESMCGFEGSHELSPAETCALSASTLAAGGACKSPEL